jgi:DNA-binding transcriptional ArsR family regulator
MQFTIYINQPRATEWGLNLQQATLFAFLYELPSWATCHIIDGVSYYRIAYGKIISELPILSQRKDTIYRHMKALAGLGVIEVQQQGANILVRVTRKGAVWNRDGAGNPAFGKKSERSEENPSLLGKISGPTSEKNPTNHNTTYPPTRSVNHPPFSPSGQEQQEVEEYIRLETDRAYRAGEIRTTKAKYAAGLRRQIDREGGRLTPERRQQLELWRSPPPAPRSIPDSDLYPSHMGVQQTLDYLEKLSG